mgnify:CR=1 FL=1
MLGKIIDGVLTYPPHRIVLNGMQIFNPTEEQLMQAGWKTVTETPIPEEPAPEGQHYEAQYTDAGDTIMQSWVLVDNPPADTSKTLEQRVTDLENNQNDMNRIFEEVVNGEAALL